MLTTETLFQQYESRWQELSPRSRAAFRGNLTWLLGKTSDPTERARLLALRERIQPTGAAGAGSATSPVTKPAARTFAVSTTTLQLRRRTIHLRDEQGLGTHIAGPAAAVAVAHRLIGDQPQEHLLLLLLDRHNQITGVHTVHIGTTFECMACPADILRVALLANAPSIVLCHNHPSGNPTPSDADLESTRAVAAACQLLGVQLFDHVIVTDDPARFTSLATRERSLFSRTYQWQ